MSRFYIISYFACILALLISSFGCSSYDSDYIPYMLKGLDVWVYDNVNEVDLYGGRVKASYFSKDDALAECASYANSTAQQNNLSDWSYVCCMVTSSSSCVTKVR